MMSVVPGSLIAATEFVNDEVQTMGFGFMQEHVGQPLPADRAHHELAAKTLATFHARTPPLYHGDARVANVVLVSAGRVAWLDWMYSHSLVHGRVDDIKASSSPRGARTCGSASRLRGSSWRGTAERRRASWRPSLRKSYHCCSRRIRVE
jgi:hypothetical protein